MQQVQSVESSFKHKSNLTDVNRELTVTCPAGMQSVTLECCNKARQWLKVIFYTFPLQVEQYMNVNYSVCFCFVSIFFLFIWGSSSLGLALHKSAVPCEATDLISFV